MNKYNDDDDEMIVHYVEFLISKNNLLIVFHRDTETIRIVWLGLYSFVASEYYLFCPGKIVLNYI